MNSSDIDDHDITRLYSFLFFPSYPYLTIVPACNLWRHLSNIDVILRIWSDSFSKWETFLLKRLTSETVVTPTHFNVCPQEDTYPWWLELHYFREGFMVHWYLIVIILINSLAPGKHGSIFKDIIFKRSIQNSGLATSCEIACRWMPQKLGDDKPFLVQVMALCQQATSHQWSLCLPRSVWPYGITRPQWFNISFMYCHITSIPYHKNLTVCSRACWGFKKPKPQSLALCEIIPFPYEENTLLIDGFHTQRLTNANKIFMS